MRSAEYEALSKANYPGALAKMYGHRLGWPVPVWVHSIIKKVTGLQHLNAFAWFVCLCSVHYVIAGTGLTVIDAKLFGGANPQTAKRLQVV